jgi:hypothetical protein
MSERLSFSPKYDTKIETINKSKKKKKAFNCAAYRPAVVAEAMSAVQSSGIAESHILEAARARELLVLVLHLLRRWLGLPNSGGLWKLSAGNCEVAEFKKKKRYLNYSKNPWCTLNTSSRPFSKNSSKSRSGSHWKYIKSSRVKACDTPSTSDTWKYSINRHSIRDRTILLPSRCHFVAALLGVRD